MNRDSAVYTTPLMRYGMKIAFSDLPRNSRNLLLTIAYHLMELDILKERISSELSAFTDKRAAASTLQQTHNLLMLSIHSYVIAWANIGKSLRSLGEQTGDQEIQRIYRRRPRWFETMTRARNSLEHIEERATRKPGIRNSPDIMRLAGFRHPAMVVVGIKVDISEIAMRRIEIVSDEIESWLDKQPYRWRDYYVSGSISP